MKLNSWCGFVLVACGVAPPPISAPPVREVVVEVPVTRYCLARPAPPFVPVPRAHVCAPGKFCWDKPDFAHLIDDVEQLTAYLREVTALCSPPAPASQPEPAHPP